MDKIVFSEEEIKEYEKLIKNKEEMEKEFKKEYEKLKDDEEETKKEKENAKNIISEILEEKEVKYYIYDEDGQFYKTEDKTLISAFTNDKDIYKRIDINGEFVIFELDKNQIKNYVKYLIKGMEGSRELGSILINRYIQIFIVIFLFFMMFLLSSRPTTTQIEEIIKNNGIQKNIMEKMTTNTQKSEIKIIDNNK